jgi:hypothetical protein
MRKLKEGMLVKVDHPEVSPKLEWLVVNVIDAGDGPVLYELKSTGKMPQSLTIPSHVQYTALDNTLPPVIQPVMGMALGNSYHQDRRLLKRIIEQVYVCKLKIPQTDFPLGEVAQASWDRAINAEEVDRLHAFKKDLKEVCGSRKKQQSHGHFSMFYTEKDNFDEDFQAALSLFRRENGGAKIDYGNWLHFLGIYACYRKIIETAV